MPHTIEAKLTDSTGQVSVERNGETIQLEIGDAIYESDIIITGDETTADITYRDGTKSRISPDTKIKLVDFEFGEEDNSFMLEVTQGAIRNATGGIVKLNPEGFEIITPRATVGIRGTETFHSVDGENETHAV